MQPHQQTVSNWLGSIGQTRNIPLSLGEDGHCIIKFENDLECFIEVPRQSEVIPIYVYCPMLKLPSEQSTQCHLLKAALELNMFGLQTGSCQLSFDQRTNQIVLTFACDLNMLDQELFSHFLSDFLDIASQLNIKFQELEALTFERQDDSQLKDNTSNVIKTKLGIRSNS